MSRLLLKAQSSVEFMIIFIFFIAILTIAVAVTSQQMESILNSQIIMESEKVSNNVVTRINTAFLEGHGFSINFTIPDKILSYEYSARIDYGGVLINLIDKIFYKPILTSNITGIINFISGNTYTIKNTNGGLVIS